MKTLKLNAIAATLSAFLAASSVQAQAPLRGSLHDEESSWNGAYVGGSLGAGWGSIGSMDMEGATVGVHIGFQRRLGRVVVGVEADFSGSLIEASENVAGVMITAGPSWIGSIRGRVGADIGPALIYATGGFAFGGAELSGLPDVSSG